MGILSDLFKRESENFNTIKVPTFIKEFSRESENIKELEQILAQLNNTAQKDTISKEISLMRMGLAGESTVNFELRNCTFPFLCLHDIRLEYEGLVAQIDYLIISKKFICVLETKQLQGNVNINSEGEFIRVYKEKNGHESKTGMYSPVEQNKKHVNLIKRILKEQFDFTHIPIKSVIVMSNPKAIINKKYAPKEIQDQIIRAEKLDDYLLNLMKITEDVVLKEETAFKLANYFNDAHKPTVFDFRAKFGLIDADLVTKSEETNITSAPDKNADTLSTSGDNTDEEVSENKLELSENDKELLEQLKNYRNKIAKEEGLNFKRYHFIFSNATALHLVEMKPKSTGELLKIKGLGEVKVSKYGQGIIRIIQEHERKQIIVENKIEGSQNTNTEDLIRERLKAYRLEASRKENIKPYFIYNNEQMEEIIRLRPKAKKDLLEIKGFGEVKVQKYGEGIIGVFS